MSLGTIANDLALISLNTGAISKYYITIDFEFMRTVVPKIK